MKIKLVKSMPDFIERYAEKDMNIKTIFDNFRNEFNQIELEHKHDDRGVYYSILNPSNNIIEFVKFYLEKSQLDAKLYCAYENELNLSKSVMHELLFGYSENNHFSFYIDSYKNNEVKIRFI